VWSVLGIGALQPLAQACVLGLIAGAVLKLRREPDLARDRARMAALAAAILLALQLAADHWAFLYLAWVMPLVCLSLLAERAVTLQPAIARAPAASDAEAPAC
jgi:chromate transport protein ChrA